MKKQFTKGKWEIIEEGRLSNGEYQYSISLGTGIDSKEIGICWGDTEEEANANAKLIASAPNMFEMLEKIFNIEDHAFTLKGFDVKRLKSEILETLNKATK